MNKCLRPAAGALICVLAATCPSPAADHVGTMQAPPLHLPAQSVRCAGTGFFHAEVPAAALMRDRLRRAMPIAVASGGLTSVYLFPNQSEGETHERLLLAGIIHEPGEATLRLPTETAKAGQAIIALSIQRPESSPDSVPGWLRQWAIIHTMYAARPDQEGEYARYLHAAYSRRFDFPDVSFDAFGPAPRQGMQDTAHPYDIFTGAAAIRESMQLDRGAASRMLSDSGDIDIGTVEPLTLKDHPFDQMRAGRPYRSSDLDRLCPRDALFVRIQSLQEWFRMKDLLERWGGSLLTTIQVNGRELRLADRYLAQLACGDEFFARLAGTRLVGEVGLVAADPLFAEGTAVALIFSPLAGQESAFKGLFDLQRGLKVKQSKGTSHDTYSVENITVDRLTTPDRRICSHTCVLNGKRVFCNSPALLKRIIHAALDESASLSAAPDYRYYRALFPLDEQESAFVFLSQDWFRYITGPAWRIARGRRALAMARMREIRFAWETALAEGHVSANLDALGAMKLLDAAEDDSMKVGLDPGDGRVSIEPFGTLTAPEAIDDHLPRKVTPDEDKLYDLFRDNYTRYWRQYIDPVGIRLRVTDRRVSVDTLILPLIENSIYNGLRSMVTAGAGKTMNAPVLPDDALGAVTLRLNPLQAAIPLMGLWSYQGREEPQAQPDWIGDSMTIGVADGDMLFTTSIESGVLLSGMIGRPGNPGEMLGVAVLLSSITLPTFVIIDANEPEAINAYLDTLLVTSMRQNRSWFRVTKYQTGDDPPVHTLTFTLGRLVDIRLHYAFVNRRLLIATKPALLQRLITAAQGEPNPPLTGDANLTIRPPAFNRASTALGIAWQERIAKACAGNLQDLQRTAAARRFDAARQFLGYENRCPEGGSYTLADGLVRCSVHGSIAEPVQPLTPPQDAPAIRLIRQMERLNIQLGFTEDGLQTHLELDLTAAAATAPAAEPAGQQQK